MAEERYGLRLQTENYRPTKSEAIDSIDYSPKAKIIEIEFKDDGIYHYLDAKKTEWKKMLEFVENKKGLGGYVNQTFKEPYKKREREYYRLIVLEEKSNT